MNSVPGIGPVTQQSESETPQSRDLRQKLAKDFPSASNEPEVKPIDKKSMTP